MFKICRNLLLSVLPFFLYSSDLYIAGYQNINSQERATIWITEEDGSVKDTLLLGEAYLTSKALSLIIDHNKIYCSGYQQNPNNQLINSATLWIINLKDLSSTTIILGSSINSSESSSLTILNNRVYCVGYEMDLLNTPKARLWSFDINSFSKSSSIQLSSESYPSGANDITHIKNKLYCVGYQIDSSNIINATMWIINTKIDQNPSPILLGNGVKNSKCSSIFENKNLLYCSGFQSNSSGNSLATMWITNTNGQANFSPILLSNESIESNAYSTNEINKAFLNVGYQQKQLGISLINIAALWITPKNFSSSYPIILGDTEAALFSSAQSIVLLNKKIYIVGIQSKNSQSNAVIWMTDTVFSSIKEKFLSNYDSQAMAICTQTNRVRAIYDFSPIRYQIGIQNQNL